MLLSLWNDLALFSMYHPLGGVFDSPAREDALGIVPLAFYLRTYGVTLQRE
jgi:hypothetical protein